MHSACSGAAQMALDPHMNICRSANQVGTVVGSPARGLFASKLSTVRTPGTRQIKLSQIRSF